MDMTQDGYGDRKQSNSRKYDSRSYIYIHMYIGSMQMHMHISDTMRKYNVYLCKN